MQTLKHAVLGAALALWGHSALAAAPVKVGIALDISGPFAAAGAEARAGFDLAIEQLGGTLGGVPAEFLQTDFAGNPEQVNQLGSRYLQRDRVDFFTGPIASNAALAAGPALFAARVPYVSSNPGPSQFAGKQCNRYFFAQYQNDTFDEAAGVVANQAGYRNMVILAPNYPAGRDHLGGFKRTYQGKVADEIYTKVGQIDYAAELAHIRSARPDAVFIFLPGAMGINFIKQYTAAGLQGIPLLAPGFSADEDVMHAVGDAMLGLQNTSHWAHDLDNPANRAFVAAFRQKYDGRYPSIYAASAYDVIMALDAAVRQVGGKVSDREAVAAALARADYPSVRGGFRYGSNQYPIQDYHLRVIEKDADGRMTNVLRGAILQDHQDAYVGDCKLP